MGDYFIVDDDLFYEDLEGIFYRAKIVDEYIVWRDAELQIVFTEKCLARYVTINEEDICTMKFRRSLAYKREGEPFYLLGSNPFWIIKIKTVKPNK